MTVTLTQPPSLEELQETKARRKFNPGSCPDSYRPGNAEEHCAQLLSTDWAYVFGNCGLVHQACPTAFELLVLQRYHANDADSSVHDYYELRRRVRVIEDEMEQARSQILTRTPGRPSLTMHYALLEFRDAVVRKMHAARESLYRATAERCHEAE
ncbi:hypothetical protein QTH97_27160 [Variovorax sp. J22R24]|uniref:hypothetical protein n=1 Tax=Variovorax gracilis TaxID=3053502 RepID=UPI002576B9EB|nr:hypothetical protein [Variovorax sp. J22R24]MDM0108655.1 hypothetical protein [Variovorax sp. J22R24]